MQEWAQRWASNVARLTGGVVSQDRAMDEHSGTSGSEADGGSLVAPLPRSLQHKSLAGSWRMTSSTKPEAVDSENGMRKEEPTAKASGSGWVVKRLGTLVGP